MDGCVINKDEIRYFFLIKDKYQIKIIEVSFYFIFEMGFPTIEAIDNYLSCKR